MAATSTTSTTATAASSIPSNEMESLVPSASSKDVLPKKNSKLIGFFWFLTTAGLLAILLTWTVWYKPVNVNPSRCTIYGPITIANSACPGYVACWKVTSPTVYPLLNGTMIQSVLSINGFSSSSTATNAIKSYILSANNSQCWYNIKNVYQVTTASSILNVVNGGQIALTVIAGTISATFALIAILYQMCRCDQCPNVYFCRRCDRYIHMDDWKELKCPRCQTPLVRSKTRDC